MPYHKQGSPRRYFLFALCVLNSARAAQTAPLPAALGWYQIPNTQLRPVCAGEHGFPEVLGNSGCPSITGAWSGGNTVYLLDTGTWTWTPVTYPNGPGAALGAGTYGRFRYLPGLGVYAVANSVDSNAYALRLTSGTGDTLPPAKPRGLRLR